MSLRPHNTERKPTSTSLSTSHTHEVPSTSIDRNCTLQEAGNTIVNIYHQYAPRQYKDDYLSLKDLTELLQEQAPIFLQACGRDRPGYIEELFKKMDCDRSGHLTFEEFMPVMNMMLDDAHRLSHGDDRCGPDRD